MMCFPRNYVAKYIKTVAPFERGLQYRPIPALHWMISLFPRGKKCYSKNTNEFVPLKMQLFVQLFCSRHVNFPMVSEQKAHT